MTQRISLFGHTALRVIVLALLLWISAVPMTQADPSDDFSFTLAQAGSSEAYEFVSAAKISAVFRDRLDRFPRSQAPKLARHLLGLCATYRFDPAFVLALIKVESRFRIHALSPVGAVGLMQIMPATARRVVEAMQLELPLGKGSRRLTSVQLADPYINLTIGVAYLAWLRNHYRGQPPYYLVAAYNAGPTKIDALLLKGPTHFRAVQTKRYFEAVRRGIPEFKSYAPS